MSTRIFIKIIIKIHRITLEENKKIYAKKTICVWMKKLCKFFNKISPYEYCVYLYDLYVRLYRLIRV